MPRMKKTTPSTTRTPPSSRDAEHITGVYCYACAVTGAMYVGGAYTSFVQRDEGHRKDLRRGKHGNEHFQNAWNKYGEAAFTYEILVRCPPEDVKDNEQEWLNWLWEFDPKLRYNKSPTAGSTLGFKHTEESKERHSKAARERMTPEVRAKVANTLRGRPSPKKGEKMDLTDEQRARMKKAATERLTPEVREKISNTLKGRVPAHKGRPMKQEQKDKLSEYIYAHMEEHKARLRAAWALRKGRGLTDNQIEGYKRSALKLKGRVITQETIEKRRQTRARNKQRRLDDARSKENDSLQGTLFSGLLDCD